MARDAKPMGHLILAVDDDPAILEVIEARLEAAGYRTATAHTAEEALEVLVAEPVDLVVSDVKMPGMGGEGLLREVLAKWPDIPVILLTAFGSIPDAVDSMRTGAADYLTKPFDGRALLERIGSMLADRGPRAGSGAASGPSPVAGVMWGGEDMAELHALIERVARSDVGVLLTGESGTGKEMAARAIHELSPRAHGPLVVVDCGSTPATLLESELFGHVKGSFTHAVRDKKGLIAEAHGGTLFLDEIGNISKEMQTRLLRFLQERTIRRIGDTREVAVDCRVVAATNADLPDLVARGEFREDLYFRLKVVTVRIPPLRERAGDVAMLAKRFLEEFARAQGRKLSFSTAALERLSSYAWPGNVRELKNVVEAATVFCQDGVIEPGDLQLEEGVNTSRSAPGSSSREGAGEAAGPGGAEGGAEPAPNRTLSLEESEREAILRALSHTGWNRTRAADVLGISRRAIHYKIKKYGLDEPGRDSGDSGAGSGPGSEPESGEDGP